jgi:hypothetical protein
VGAVFGEVCATSDIPPGVVNILTGQKSELVPQFATHRDIDAIHAAGVSAQHAKLIREGTADNLKRVCLYPEPRAQARAKPPIDWFDDDRCHSPWMIEPFVEMKTMWHPSGPDIRTPRRVPGYSGDGLESGPAQLNRVGAAHSISEPHAEQLHQRGESAARCSRRACSRYRSSLDS